jgi:hypothetical protein
MECLNEYIEKYNSEVFSNYDKVNANLFDTTLLANFPMLGGAPPVDYTSVTIPDSYYNQDNTSSVNLNTVAMDADLIGKPLFIIMGGGPIGLSLAAYLCDTYNDIISLVVDTRVSGGTQHIRSPFTRERRLSGLGLLAINDVESALYTVLRQRTNIRFLFVRSPTILTDLVRAYLPRFVFNCTGSRSREFVNDIADTLILNRDRSGKIMQIIRNMDGDYFVGRDNTFVPLPDPTNDYHYLDIENIITFTQGDFSLDVWTNIEMPDGDMGTKTYMEAYDFADSILRGGLVESPTSDAISQSFTRLDRRQPVVVSKFVAGLRIHSRYPCQAHSLQDHIFVKFDMGDSMGSVPVRYGNNIAIGRKIIMGLLLPVLDSMMKCLEI